MASPRTGRLADDRWQRVQELFLAAADLDPSERSRYLAEACGDDLELLREVRSLLASDGADLAALAEPIIREAEALAAESKERQCGPYRLLRLLGEGGMGAVYLAERSDGAYEKQVAVKLARRGWNSPALLARFRTERQALARLEHPNIARLLDGGATPGGEPYLVMEYIQGEPIDQYCRERALDSATILRLFLRVCSAVSEAHRHLIIHRDLKPANILVTEGGVPKLLDFGISKIIAETPGVQETQLADRLLTPAYASPEQARGEPVTTAGDIYSLGVVLSELLTGALPFEFTGRRPSEIERIISDADPDPVPAGDSGSIVRKAMQKRPQDRYTSVEQLAADIERHLQGYPVVARPYRWTDRAFKFFVRHRLAVSAAAAIILTLCIGLFVTVRAEQKAERRLQTAIALANSALFEVHDAVAALPGATAARSLIVNRALQHLDELVSSGSDEPALNRELATAYARLRDIQFRESAPNLGDSAGALVSARKAIAQREKDPGSRLLLSQDYARLAAILRLSRNIPEALKSARRAVALTHGDTEIPAAADARLAAAEALRELAEVERIMEVRQQSVAHLQRARVLLDHDTGSAALHEHLADDLSLNDVLREENNPKDALAIMSEALSLLEKAGGAKSLQNEAIRVESRFGHTLLALKDYQAALDHYQTALAITRELAASDPVDARLTRNVALQQTNAAQPLLSLNRLEEAKPILRSAIALHKSLMERDPQSQQAPDDLAYTEMVLGKALIKSGAYQEAEEVLKTALSRREKLLAANPENSINRHRAADICDLIGQIEESQSTCEAANPWYQRADSLGRFEHPRQPSRCR